MQIAPLRVLAFTQASDPNVLLQVGIFFFKAGAFTFGSGLAIVPFLQQGVVRDYGWLSEREFLDAVAMGMITPGPVVITAVFVGYLVAGLAGATVAGIGVFLPPFLMVVLFAPWIIRHRKHPVVQDFTKGAAAAAAGAIVGAAGVIATQVLVDVPTVAIFLVACVVLWRFRFPEVALVGASAAVGLALFGLANHAHQAAQTFGVTMVSIKWMRRAAASQFLAGLLATLTVIAACGSLATPSSAAPLTSTEQFAATIWPFEKDAVGSVPTGATSFSGRWAVRAEPGTPSPPNAICETATAEFPALQLSADVHRDMAISAQVKPISGSEDRVAGLLLRIQDANNYYIVRANALEGSVVIFKYVNGARSEIKSGSTTVSTGVWQQLRAEVSGTTLRGFLGGRLIVEATDTTFRQGGVGLWTKADSTTCFDDVTVGPLGSS